MPDPLSSRPKIGAGRHWRPALVISASDSARDDYRESLSDTLSLTTACAAARRATGTRKGEQLT